MLSEEYWKIENLFVELFGTSYLENNDFPNSNRDIEVIQQVTIPTINKTFKKVTSSYSELIELSVSSEKGRKIVQKRRETELLFKEQLNFLIHITRMFLLLILEVNGTTALDDRDSMLSCVRMPNLPLRLFHELLGSPGTKDCKIFLMDLTLLQSNKLLVDQLYGYLSGFTNTIQYECFNIRRELLDSSGHAMNHQLLPITSNYENSSYFPYLFENEECIGIILFKIQNLIRHLWRIDKSYGDLIAWWRRNKPEFMDEVRLLDLKAIYDHFEKGDSSYILNSTVNKYFSHDEYWELSSLCLVTSHVLYLVNSSILDNKMDVLEIVLSLNMKCQAYSTGELVRESIKFSLMSLLLDPANYKASWMLSLLHLCDGEHFSLIRAYKFVGITLDLNPCFNDAWILYSLLLSRKDWLEFVDFKLLDATQGDDSIYSERNQLKEVDNDSQLAIQTFITTKLISLNQNNDSLALPLRFVRLGYKVHQILKNNSPCSDLLCAVNSEIMELCNRLTSILESRYGDKLYSVDGMKSETQSSVYVESSTPTRSKGNKGGNGVKNLECCCKGGSLSVHNSGKSSNGNSKRRSCRHCELNTEKFVKTANIGTKQEHFLGFSLIVNPFLFKLQIIVWSLKLKYSINSDSVHICLEYIRSQIQEAMQLYKDLFESETNILDELGVHTYLKDIVHKYMIEFGELFDCFDNKSSNTNPTRRSTREISNLTLFDKKKKESAFEADLLDWRLLLGPIHLL